MAIDYVIGDATKPYGLGPKVICHCVNDIGRWGSGFVLALAKWPRAEAHYREWHRTGSSASVVNLDPKTNDPVLSHFHLGSVQFVEVESEVWVANVVGQHRTIQDEEIPIRYQALEMGLKKVASFCQSYQATAHMPRLGAGLARGDWKEISTIIDCSLVKLGISTTVYDLKNRAR